MNTDFPKGPLWFQNHKYLTVVMEASLQSQEDAMSLSDMLLSY